MIYFDNAATGGFKPNASIDSAETVMKYLSANPGRSGHRLSVTGEKIVLSAREVFAKELGVKEERVIFTKNCTEALNTVILGTYKKGGKVITTIYEHNSVLRPLYFLKNAGLINLEIVEPKSNDIVSAIKNAITPDVYMVVTTAVSNLTGISLPVDKIGAICKEYNIIYVVDGAQAGGHVKLKVDGGISAICFAGHKGLYGIMSSGVLAFCDDLEINPLMFGGTGTETLNLSQPSSYPERLEAGTLNLPAIASLKEGASYAFSNLSNFAENLVFYTEKIINGLNNISKIKCYSSPNPAGIVSFAVDGMQSAEVADALNLKYDIAVRSGLHCAPLYHKFLHTEEDGLTRCSLAVQNSSREIDTFLLSLNRLCNNLN